MQISNISNKTISPMAGGGTVGGSKAICFKTSTRSEEDRKTPPRLKKVIPQLISTVSASLRASNSFLSLNDIHLLQSQAISLRSLISSVNNLLSSLSSSPPLLLPPPPSSWFHRFLSHPSQDPTLWLHSFNMSKNSFDLLLSTLLPHLHRSLLSTPPTYALASSLFRLTHGSPYRYTSKLFSMDTRDSCTSFYIVCKCIMENLRLFTDENRIFSGFQSISLPNCCGVLGIRSFPLKGEAKVKALMVVDCEERFVDVSVGWPNSMKTDLIVSNCMLFAKMESSGGRYVLGDSSFPLLPWLLTPCGGGEEGLPLPHARFNEVHRVGMEIAEMAMERVCRQWRILSMEWKEECTDFLPYVVVTCCLLHNFLVQNEGGEPTA